jgi:hypothetical protein
LAFPVQSQIWDWVPAVVEKPVAQSLKYGQERRSGGE